MKSFVSASCDFILLNLELIYVSTIASWWNYQKYHVKVLDMKCFSSQVEVQSKKANNKVFVLEHI